MEEKIKELEKEYERLIKESDIHRMAYRELDAKAVAVQNEITQFERSGKYKTLSQGSVLRFKDEDDKIIQCRLIYINEKYYDLMVEIGNKYYSYCSTFGYKCRYVDTLIDHVCEDHELELVETISYDDIEE